MTARVVCLGDLMVDVLVRLTAPLQVGSDTPADVSWLGGGSAANTACWLAADGVDVMFGGRVGSDVPGAVSVDTLRAAGVRPAVAIDASLPTGTCVVLVDEDGERTMIPSPGANGALSTSDVDALGITAGDHLHVSGYALFGGARPAALYAMDLARTAGCTVSLGAASAAPLRSVGAAEFLAWSAGTTLFANRDEAAALVDSAILIRGKPDAAAGVSRSAGSAAARALGAVSGTAVVTSGSGGATWSDGVDLVHVASVPADAVDSTGAGDAFAAGYLAAVLRGSGVKDALRHGCELAARACEVVGGRPVSGGR
jgi:sugar/nucleoside kinase (ribokinase family)